jgi:hypothetical protein
MDSKGDLWSGDRSDPFDAGSDSLLSRYSEAADIFGISYMRSSAEFNGNYFIAMIEYSHNTDDIAVFFFKECFGSQFDRFII